MFNSQSHSALNCQRVCTISITISITIGITIGIYVVANQSGHQLKWHRFVTPYLVNSNQPCGSLLNLCPVLRAKPSVDGTRITITQRTIQYSTLKRLIHWVSLSPRLARWLGGLGHTSLLLAGASIFFTESHEYIISPSPLPLCHIKYPLPPPPTYALLLVLFNLLIFPKTPHLSTLQFNKRVTLLSLNAWEHSAVTNSLWSHFIPPRISPPHITIDHPGQRKSEVSFLLTHLSIASVTALGDNTIFYQL